VECLKDQFLVLSFFLLYINDLPSIVTKENNVVLYADDASFVITNTDRADFNTHINVLFNDINNWFESNLLNLNFTKTYYLEFSPSKRHKPHTLIQHNSKYVSNATQTNFLGLSLDDTLTWNYHTESLMKKMSAASYALRQVKYTLSTDSLKLIYFAHVQSIMNYGVIFWGNSPSAKKVFILQKKIIRIIANIGMRDSCREIFKNLQIMTLYSLYAYSIILFVVKNKHLFTVNNEIHKYNTRNNKNLHPALPNLTKFIKGPCMSGIKAYNHLPQYLKTLDQNSSYFRSSLKCFFYQHPFYTMEEYYEYGANLL